MKTIREMRNAPRQIRKHGVRLNIGKVVSSFVHEGRDLLGRASLAPESHFSNLS